MKEYQGIARLWMLVEALGHQNVSTQRHRPTPELTEQLALQLDVSNVLRVGRLFDRWDHLVEDNLDPAATLWIDGQLLGRAQEVARRAIPVLAFTLVHWQLDNVTGRQLEGVVFVQDRLDPVVTGRNGRETLHRESESLAIDDRVFRGTQPLDVDSEDQRRLGTRTDLEAGLRTLTRRQYENHPTVERSGSDRLLVRNGELELAVRAPAIASDQEK